MTDRNKQTFRKKAVLLQLGLIIPITALLITFVFVTISNASLKELRLAKEFAVTNAATGFDNIYDSTVRILERPYSDPQIYSVLTTRYGPDETVQKYHDQSDLQNHLYRTIMYYNTNISSITIYSAANQIVYYKRVYPSTMVNIHNDVWQNIAASSWVVSSMNNEKLFVNTNQEDDLYVNEGRTVVFTKQLKNISTEEPIGVIRMDMSLNQLTDAVWSSIVTNDNDGFFIQDSDGKVLYTTTDAVLDSNSELYDFKALSRKYYVDSYTAPKSKFKFTYVTSRDAFFTSNIKNFSMPLLLMLISMGFIAVYISWSARSLDEPIQILKKAMVKGQNKQLDVHCEQLPGEMNQLSDAFNDMMLSINQLVEEVKVNEQEKNELFYQTLQSKISPHFLYNTLNAIQWKASTIGAREISSSLNALSSFLKFTIKCTSDVVPFKTEFEQLENYISIMRVRYGDDIEINYDIDEQCFDCMCMKFLLQLLVENCYIHAFAGNRRSDKLITVKVACVNVK